MSVGSVTVITSVECLKKLPENLPPTTAAHIIIFETFLAPDYIFVNISHSIVALMLLFVYVFNAVQVNGENDLLKTKAYSPQRHREELVYQKGLLCISVVNKKNACLTSCSTQGPTYCESCH